MPTHLEGLNPAPRTAATAPAPLQVLASAGSGKTETLIRRLADLILAGERPDRLLCITFTAKAAGEMRSRLAALLGPPAPRHLRNRPDLDRPAHRFRCPGHRHVPPRHCRDATPHPAARYRRATATEVLGRHADHQCLQQVPGIGHGRWLSCRHGPKAAVGGGTPFLDHLETGVETADAGWRSRRRGRRGGQGLLARHRELCCGLRSTYHINLDHALGPATMAVLDPVLQAAGGTAEVGFRHEDQGGKLLRPQPVAYLQHGRAVVHEASWQIVNGHVQRVTIRAFRSRDLEPAGIEA